MGEDNGEWDELELELELELDVEASPHQIIMSSEAQDSPLMIPACKLISDSCDCA